MEGDAEKPEFAPGELVESKSGFFRGTGEVVRKLHTRYLVAHQGDGGQGRGEVQTACAPKNLRRVKGKG